MCDGLNNELKENYVTMEELGLSPDEVINRYIGGNGQYIFVIKDGMVSGLRHKERGTGIVRIIKIIMSKFMIKYCRIHKLGFTYRKGNADIFIRNRNDKNSQQNVFSFSSNNNVFRCLRDDNTYDCRGGMKIEKLNKDAIEKFGDLYKGEKIWV